MYYVKPKILSIVLIVFLFLQFSSIAYATSSGRNMTKGTPSKVVMVDKATKLAAKSYVIKKYGRNIKILSNRHLSSESLEKPELKKYNCRKIVLKTRTGDRKTLKICGKKLD
jgi:hypothetical protein